MSSAIVFKNKDGYIKILSVSDDDYEAAIEIYDDEILNKPHALISDYLEKLDQARIDYYFMDYTTYKI